MPEIVQNPYVEKNNAISDAKQELLYQRREAWKNASDDERALQLIQRYMWRHTPKGQKSHADGSRKYRHSNRGKDNAKKYGSRPEVLEKMRIKGRLHRAALRLEVLKHYSCGKLICACCGEFEYDFLSLDHVDGGGTKQRKEIKRKCGAPFFHWLKQNNFPSGFQVLCYNCNLAKGFVGSCPHQRNKSLLIEDRAKEGARENNLRHPPHVYDH